MNAQNNSSSVSKKHIWLKVVIALVIVTIVMIGGIVMLIPAYISSDGGTQMVVGKINDSIDGKVEMQDLQMGWFSGVKLTDLKFADNAGMTSVSVKEISTKPKYGSLIKGEVALGKTTIDQPEVVINLDKADIVKQQAAAKSEPTKTQPVKAKQEAGPIALPDIELEVLKGNVTINVQDEQMTQSVQFRDIASKFDINPAGQKSVFELALAVAGEESDSTITANGNMTTPKEGWTLKGTSGDFNVKIQDLPLEKLNAVMALAGQDINVSGNLNADVVAKVSDGNVEMVNADAVLTGFKSLTEGKEMSLSEPVELNAKVSNAGGEIKIETVDVSSSFCKLNCSGGIDAVDYSADVNITELMGFVGQFADMGKFGFAGDFKAVGKVETGAKVKTNGQYNLSNFVFTNKELKKQTSPMNFALNGGVNYDATTKSVSFESLALNSTIATASLSGTLGQGSGKSSFVANANANLGQIQPLLVVAGALPEETVLAGVAKAVLNVDMDGDNIHLSTSDTQITNLKIKKAGMEQAVEEPAVKLVLDAVANTKEKSIAVNTLSLDSTNIKVNKGTFSKTTRSGRTSIKGNMEAEYDLAKVTQMASVLMIDNLNMEGKRKATLNFDSSFPEDQKDGMLKNMNAGLAFGFDRAEYLGFEIGKADFDIRMKKGVLSLEPFSAPANNGKLNFAGSVDFNDENPVLKIPQALQVVENIQINDTLSNNFLVFVNPIFAGATSVSGVANLKCDELSIPIKASNVDDVVVDGEIAISDLRMDVKRGNFLGKLLYNILPMIGVSQSDMGADMELLPCGFTVKDSIAKYDDDMQLNIEQYPLNFKGQVGIDVAHPENGKDRIRMDLYLPATLKRTITVGQEDTPNRIIVPIKGRTNKPEVDMEALQQQMLNRVIQDQVGDLIDNALGGKKESGGDSSGNTVEDKLKEAGVEALKGLFK